MRILLVYANTLSEGFLPIGLSMIAGALKDAGHETDIFDTSFYYTGRKTDRQIREELLEFKKAKFNIEMQERLDIDEAFRRKLEDFKPGLIGLSAVSTEFNYAFSYLKIKEDYGIPLIVGGIHATAVPEEAISNPLVDMVCIGEGEVSIVELAGRMERSEDIRNIKNIWVKEGPSIYKNDIRDLSPLDKLGYADWDIFDKRHFLKPFWGEIVKYGFFELGRGCPFSCTFCMNSHKNMIYKGKGSPVRIKSAQRIIDEIIFFRKKYDFSHIYFVDETFLLQPVNELAEFARVYNRHIDLPFFMMTHVNTVTEEKIDVISSMKCKSIALGIESGNYAIRKDVCAKNITDAQIEKASSLIKGKNIPRVFYNMMGFPGETREQIFETIELNRKLRPEGSKCSIFYPFKGTRLRDVSIEKGYFSEGMDEDICFANDSVLDMPQLTRRELRGMRKAYGLYLKYPKAFWPLIRICQKDNIIADILFRMLAFCARHMET